MQHLLKILIVDDDDADRRMIRRALKGDGLAASVEDAEDCATGLSALRGRHFDCAFLDYHLPDGTGLALLREARAADVDIPIIMLTGQGDEEIAVQAIKAGATDYVTKDKASTAIGQSVRTALRMHEADKGRRQAENALRESQERFRLLIEGAKEYAIFMLDTQGRVASWNPGAERILGYAESDILGKSAKRFFVPEDRQTDIPAQERETALATGNAADTRWMQRKDGTRFWAEGVLTALYDRGGQLRGFEKVMRDATERKRAEEMVAEANAKQRAFLRDVLASVTDGRLRLCDSEADLPDPFPLCGPPVTLTQNNGLRQLRLQAQEAAQAGGFSEERCADLITAVGEAAMNAVVHAGGGQGQVCRRAAGSVQIRVTDSGAGIAVEKLPQATLQRGYTTAGTFGHGFKMLLQTVDRLWLLTGPTGTTVVLEKDQRDVPPAWLAVG